MAEPSLPGFIKLAEAYRQEGLFADAIRVCRDGLIAHADSARGRVVLVRTLLAQGSVEDAAVELAHARALAPVDPDVLEAGREIEIARAGRGGSSSPGADPLASPTLAALYASQGDTDRAAGILKTVAERKRQAQLDLLLAYRRVVQRRPTDRPVASQTAVE